MERLTKWLNDKKNLCIKKCEKECVEGYTECHKCEPFKDVMKRLADYEDAEEQGLLLRLKAGVGSKVYDVDGNEYIVKRFTYYSYFEPHFEYEAQNEEGVIWRFKDIHFGRFVFLTKEEAEAIIDERNGR